MYAPIYAERVGARLLALALLLCALGTTAVSSAQADVNEREQQAAARFERGVELYGEGNLDAALVQFERAYELIPNYRVLYNLAQIQAERHEYVAALSLYQRYLEQGGDQVPAARRDESRAQIESLREHVAELWVESDVEGAKLFVDDELVGELPLAAPISIDAGVRHVRLDKSGFVPVFRKLKVAGGDRPRLRIPLAQLAAGASDGASAADAPSLPDYRPLWISSAATLAFAAGAVTMGVLARGANDDLERALDTFPSQPQEVQESRSQLKTYAAAADALGVVSVIALGLSVYFLVAPPRAPLGERKAARASPRLTVRARGLGLVGSF
jgi:tetratricopeptide (TPR) repeat protein